MEDRAKALITKWGWWKPQPQPTSTIHPGAYQVDITEIVVAHLRARSEVGRQTYGTRLHSHNGRDPLRDALEEALDLACYLTQAIYERDHRVEG